MAIGRRSKLTAEVKTQIVNVLKGGGTDEAAFTLAGVGESTFYRWMQRGEAAKRGVFREFWEEVCRARQHAVTRNLTIIQKLAAGGDVLEKTKVTRPDGTIVEKERRAPPSFQAASWWLERKYPNDWGRRERVDWHAPDGPVWADNRQINQTNIIMIEDRAGRGARRPAISGPVEEAQVSK